MEIPDLNYSLPLRVSNTGEKNQFYSMEEDKSQSEFTQSPSAITYEDNFKSILQNEILKKTMNISWQARYFCLTPTRLLYYTSNNKSQIKGCFNLLSLSKQYLIFLEVREEEKTLKLTLFLNQQKSDVQHKFKELISLNFQNIPSRYHIWKNQLSKIIENISNQKNFHFQSPRISISQILSPQPKISVAHFWNKITISQEEFLEYANHLDIIFFKGKKPIAALQRILMRSQFDHVGILLKDSLNNVLILQAIESRGVWINEWNQMLPIFKEHYQQIAYRKLLLDGQHKVDLQRLQNYIDMVIGTRYELSLSKLFISQETEFTEGAQQVKNEENITKSRKIIEKRKNFQQNKSFFCSELIADIYIKLGLIRGKKRNQFWPRDFEGVLELQKNARLSPLMYIQMN